jgi:ubiquinone/menaquinone biosynthesis C-methylase UbiE
LNQTIICENTEKKNTKGTNVVWTEGVGEATGLQTSSVYAVFYGSSFNVMDQDKALKEAARILRPTGWLVCMWNHRDLTDMLQKKN